MLLALHLLERIRRKYQLDEHNNCITSLLDTLLYSRCDIVHSLPA